MRVAICIPCYGDPKHQFVMSLLALQKAVLLEGAVEVEIVSVRDTLVDIAREHIAVKAVEERADYLLWLDTDMTFPAHALGQLMSHNLPVVAANYRRRSFKRKISSSIMQEGEFLRPIRPKSDGLEEVDAVGLGLCLMKAEVFSNLPRPWFVALNFGEDTFFFRRLKEAKGIRPVVDHQLSTQVGHVAEATLMF